MRANATINRAFTGDFIGISHALPTRVRILLTNELNLCV
jgi:hypothetical protein